MKHKFSFRGFLLPLSRRFRAVLNIRYIRDFISRNFYALALLLLWLLVYLLKEC